MRKLPECLEMQRYWRERVIAIRHKNIELRTQYEMLNKEMEEYYKPMIEFLEYYSLTVDTRLIALKLLTEGMK